MGKVIILGVVFSMAVLVCVPAFADMYTGGDGSPYVADTRVVKNITLERVQALERRADILDAMGNAEDASRLRRMIIEWEKGGPLPSRQRDTSYEPGANGSAISWRSKPGSGICLSPWAEDVLIYTGSYAYNAWQYGNCFAVDYDSSGNLYAAVGLADSTIHVFESTDIGATWNDMLTVTPMSPEPETRLDLCVSDEGDSTLLYLFWLWPGATGGGNLWCGVWDYTSWTWLRQTMLDSTLDDSITNFWAVRDHYFGEGYYLHAAYQKGGDDGEIFYTYTDDHGAWWDVPRQLGTSMGSPCIEYGGYNNPWGVLYIGALDTPTSAATDAWVCRSLDWGTTWEPWTDISFTGDVIDVVVGASQMDADSQLAHAIVTLDLNNDGDYNLYPRYTTDGGTNWNSQLFISMETDKDEELASIGVHRSIDNADFYCAYYMNDTTSGAWDDLMVVFTDTTDWDANKPGVSVNDSAYAPGIRPQLTYGGALVGVAYAGTGGTNVYYDNVWFTAVEERREGRIHPRLTLNLLQNSPNPFRTRTSISYVLPARSKVSLKVYNTTGQVVRILYDGEQDVGIHTVPWDGLDRFGEQVPAGVYIYNLSTRMGALSKKLVLVR